MSAFVVNNEHINALVNFGLKTSYWNPVTQCREPINLETAQQVGQVLLSENQRSVNYRYDESNEAPVFKFKIRGGHKPVQIIKACHCLDYQSCETPDWEHTIAHSILEAIKSKAENALPGYEQAQWEIRPKGDAWPRLIKVIE